MAQKRMFDKSLLETDDFMDMPMTTKALYFLLGMEADDEGFVSPKRVMRLYGGTDDDLKVLVAKKYVIRFESGVVVITDWKENNYLDKKRIKETKYINEKKLLGLSKSKYFIINECLTDVKQVLSQYSIEENRIEENKEFFYEKKNKIPFINFWTEYDKKVGRPKCEKKWDKLKLEEQEEILAYLPKYKMATKDKTYRKNPETFLNNRSWEDEIVGKLESIEPTHWADDLPLYGDKDIENKLKQGIIKFNQITKKYEKNV